MYEAQVKKGAAWLDANVSGWVNTINIRDFYVGDYNSCALGQSVGATASKNLCAGAFGLEHGFRLPGYVEETKTVKGWFGGVSIKKVVSKKAQDVLINEYHLLSQAWLQEIFRRRAAARIVTAEQPG